MWNDSVTESIRHFKQEILDLNALNLGCYPTGNDQQKCKAINQIIAKIKYLPPLVRQNTSEEIVRLTETLLPNDLMMTSDQVRNMRNAGMQIGAHTVSHPILACTEESIALDEIVTSKADLEKLLGEEISLFAYPNGKPQEDYLLKHARMIEAAGFRAALSTAWGSANLDTDLFQIPRYTPWNKTPLKFAIRLIQNLRRNANH
jgi:peptidoglycan/xylan/chitin deacetylase (PgdA/CDA1 family)